MVNMWTQGAIKQIVIRYLSGAGYFNRAGDTASNKNSYCLRRHDRARERKWQLKTHMHVTILIVLMCSAKGKLGPERDKWWLREVTLDKGGRGSVWNDSWVVVVADPDKRQQNFMVNWWPQVTRTSGKALNLWLTSLKNGDDNGTQD